MLLLLKRGAIGLCLPLRNAIKSMWPFVCVSFFFLLFQFTGTSDQFLHGLNLADTPTFVVFTNKLHNKIIKRHCLHIFCGISGTEIFKEKNYSVFVLFPPFFANKFLRVIFNIWCQSYLKRHNENSFRWIHCSVLIKHDNTEWCLFYINYS